MKIVLYDKIYKIKKESVTGYLIDSQYREDKDKIIYSLESIDDEKHRLFDVWENELEEIDDEVIALEDNIINILNEYESNRVLINKILIKLKETNNYKESLSKFINILENDTNKSLEYLINEIDKFK